MISIFIIAGWLGMALIILAYALLALKKLKSASLSYNILNFFGGAGLLATAIYGKLWPVAVLNMFWMGISVFSLYKKLTIKIPYKELA